MGAKLTGGKLLCCCLLLLSGACADTGRQSGGPREKQFTLDSLAKTDLGLALEIHVEENRAYLRELMNKLYLRNPRELRKSAHPTAQENIRRLFDEDHDWLFPELENRRGIEAIQLSLAPEYRGDRVFAYVSGLTSMIMAAYRYKTEFWLLESADPQSLYNCARNLEIASWKLRHDTDSAGEPLIYSNSQPGEPENLSYERLFGKLIALQDTMAVIVAGKTNRTISKVILNMATAVFLPVF